jgi:hypothetical protein
MQETQPLIFAEPVLLVVVRWRAALRDGSGLPTTGSFGGMTIAALTNAGCCHHCRTMDRNSSTEAPTIKSQEKFVLLYETMNELRVKSK